MDLKYRPDIDGLRCIAIISVIFYHLDLKINNHFFFQGGFLGVDIFFVISGYLITRILLNEFYTNKKINFANFYERRARRILPMLFFIILLCIPISYYLLLPDQLINFSKSIIASSFFSSNIFFYLNNIEYGAKENYFQPLLHTWSLGVEEQFYIFFPFILIFSTYFSKISSFLTLLSLVILSLILSEFLSNKSSQFNFFMIFGRFWELGLGSLIAYYELKKMKVYPLLFCQIMSLLGIVLITYSIFFISNDSTHPGFITLIPTIGAALIIFAHNYETLVFKILSLKLFVAVGLISYSLYLWHFPIFSFNKILFNNITLFHNLGLIILIFSLSILSFYFIEKPFRNINFISRKKFIYSIILFSSLVIIFNAFTLKSYGFKSRLPEILTIDSSIYTEPIWNKLTDSSNEPCYGRESNFCEIGDNKKGVINIIGDSLMASIQHNLFERIKKNYKLISLTSGACWPIINTQRYLDTNKHELDSECSLKFQNDRINKIDENLNSIIIIGGRLPLILTEKYFNNFEGGIERKDKFWRKVENIKGESINLAVKNTILHFLNNNHKVILLYPIPEVGWDVPNKLFTELKGKNYTEINNFLLNTPITTSYDVFLKRTKSTFNLLNDIHHPNLFRVYPHKIFCDSMIKDRCITHDSKKIFYRDLNHPTDQGAELINNEIMKILNLIEVNQK